MGGKTGPSQSQQVNAPGVVGKKRKKNLKQAIQEAINEINGKPKLLRCPVCHGKKIGLLAVKLGDMEIQACHNCVAYLKELKKMFK